MPDAQVQELQSPSPLQSVTHSPDFIEFKWAHFGAVGYRPHPAAASIHACQARVRTAVCGRRFGKTWIAAHEAEAVAAAPKTRGWVVAPTKTLADKVFREVWDRLVVQLKWPTLRQSQQQKYIQFAWGSELWGKTAEPGNEDSLVGEGLDFLIIDEASKMTRGQRIWEKYLNPTLMDREGRALFITTPEGYDYVYDLWGRGADPNHKDFDPGYYASFQFPSSANPYIDPEEIERMRRKTSAAYFRQEYLASFESHAGLVYKEVDSDVHVVPNALFPELDLIPRDILASETASIYCGIDFGYTNPFCCLWGLREGPPDDPTWYIFDEQYASQRLPEWHAQRLLERGGRIKARYADPNNAEARAYFRTRGIGTLSANKEVEQGIETVRRLLTFRSDGRPRLFIHRRCRNLVRELGQYRYPEDRIEGATSELPAKRHDNAPDALRYMLHSVESRIPVHFGATVMKMPSFQGRDETRPAASAGGQVEAVNWEDLPTPAWEN